MRQLSFVLFAVLCFAITSCTKEKTITLSDTSITLHHGETHQIPAQCDNPITYTSANEYHAKVSSTGLITAQYVGSTTIRLSSDDDTKNFNVTVAPQSNLYPEPNIRMGATRSSVISSLGTPDYTDANSIGYTSYSTNASFLIVLFDNSNCVKSYAVVVGTSHTNSLRTFLGERYVYVGTSGGTTFYRNGLTPSSSTLAIGMEVYDLSYWMVAYLPYNGKENNMAAIRSILKTIEGRF